jgi:hypothetical protein
MPNKSIQTDSPAKESKKPSELTKFHLAFEYDRTWSEAKQSIQHRPSKK